MKEPRAQGGATPVVGGESHAAWIDALGQVAFWFAQLEWCSYWVIDSFRPGGLTPKLAKQPFSTRTETAAVALAGHLADTQLPELAERWESFFAEILAAAHRRNAVLHSPLVVKVDRAPDGTLSKALTLAQMRDRETLPYVELHDVRDLALELERLAVRMTELVQTTGMFAPRDA